jgi:hypothetical protein
MNYESGIVNLKMSPGAWFNLIIPAGAIWRKPGKNFTMPE